MDFHLTCDFNRFYAISLKFNSVSVFVVCVYFPTNYPTGESDNDYRFILSELDGFIACISFNHLMIGVDFNTDFRSNSFRSSHLSDFSLQLGFVCLDLLLSSSINHTYRNGANCATF